MAENRYNGILKKHNIAIGSLTANDPLKVIVAAELRNILAASGKKHAHVLEIGCGEGELTKHLLAYNKDITIDALDPSRSMLRACKQHLGDADGRLRYICKDITAYFPDKKYDAVVSSQVIHNFTRPDKILTFQRIYDLLGAGGVYVMTDKVYPYGTSEKEVNYMLERQNRRYRAYLLPKVAEAIIAHEQQDASDLYRMNERHLFYKGGKLEDIGFKQPTIIDRIERDVVLVARK